jgi:hypothetical protein
MATHPTEAGSVEPGRADDAADADWLIRRLSDGHPPRRAGTPAERTAQELVAERFAALSLVTHVEEFRFSDDLYAVLALHFGLGVAATALARRRPGAGAALHALVAGSYWLDSTKRAEVLRRLLPYRPSQNLVATLPAVGERRLRIVHLAHIDAALTGLLFEPRFIRTFAHKGTNAPYPARSLAVATHAEAMGALLAGWRALTGDRHPRVRTAELVVAIPAVVSFLLNADVSRRGHTVPGAADDLSGVAASLALAQRFAADRPDGVELVYVVTGAEEAGTGGARRLCTAHRHEWDPADTVVIGLDGLTNGALFWAAEGEMAPRPLAPWLEEVLAATASDDARFAGVRRYQIPVGSTDTAPFQTAGYDATTLTCVDLAQGAPRGYHHPSDTADNLDLPGLLDSIDFAEAFLRRLCAVRLAPSAGPHPRRES